MELTPQRLREVEFSERWRGYDQEEVDDLLERVAAGIEEIERRVREVTDRAVQAEQRASEGGDADETLRRTLVLAQRTADAAIADAEERAAQRLADAEERAGALVSDAEAEARRVTEENEARLRENVSTLEAARAALQDDIDNLGKFLAEERDRLRTSLQSLLTRIDTDLTHDAAAPAVSDVDVPEPAPAEEEVDAPEPAVAEVVEVDTVTREDDDGEPTQAVDVLALAGDEDDDAADETADAAAHETADEAAVAGGAVEDGLVLSGPGREIDTEDDAFFAELRGALDDDEPLGPRDEEPVANHVGAPASALFDQELSDQGRLGPFLRRKRRELD
jgi:DivIVA domain-containing protein